MRFVFAALLILGLSAAAEARNTEYHLKISDVVQNSIYKDQLGGDVQFYFGREPTPGVAHSFGAFVANRKSNSFGRSDEAACRQAMLDALVSLRDRARELGGNAVIGIESYYDKRPSASETVYECHAGGIIAGVALRGTVATLQKR